MTRTFLFILISVIAFACKGNKELQEVVISPEEIEVIEPEEEEEEERILDRVRMDTSPIADCRELWRKKERLILEKDDERMKKLTDRGSGKITMIVKVNRAGEVVEAKIDEKNTTVNESILKGYARETVLAYVFEPITGEGPKIDCGTMIWYLDLK